MRSKDVWVVFTEDPDEPEMILGVFGSAAEADSFATRVSTRFAQGVTLGRYRPGWTYEAGSSAYRD